MIAFLQEVFRQQTLAEAVAWLSGLDLCFGAGEYAARGFRGRQRAARGMLLTETWAAGTSAP